MRGDWVRVCIVAFLRPKESPSSAAENYVEWEKHLDTTRVRLIFFKLDSRPPNLTRLHISLGMLSSG